MNEPAPTRVVITGSAIARAPNESMIQSAPVQVLSGATAATAVTEKASGDDAKAKAWLAVIEEMIKAGLQRDALLEWEKFQAAYPNYPVPAGLKAKVSGNK